MLLPSLVRRIFELSKLSAFNILLDNIGAEDEKKIFKKLFDVERYTYMVVGAPKFIHGTLLRLFLP